MGRRSYYFNIPLDQWEEYLQHIVYGMYGVKEGGFKVKGDYNGVRRIDIETDPQFPLIVSLPETVKRSDRLNIYCTNEELINEVDKCIRRTLNDYFAPGGTFYENPQQIKISKGELPLVVKQLAANGSITKFAELDHNRYIIFIDPMKVTIILKEIDGVLIVNIFADCVGSPFDIDDGYSEPLACLNSGWTRWKEQGKLSAPIQPPNYV